MLCQNPRVRDAVGCADALPNAGRTYRAMRICASASADPGSAGCDLGLEMRPSEYGRDFDVGVRITRTWTVSGRNHRSVGRIKRLPRAVQLVGERGTQPIGASAGPI
jgi:hypothetical protein